MVNTKYQIMKQACVQEIPFFAVFSYSYVYLYDVNENRYTTMAIVRTEAPPTSCT